MEKLKNFFKNPINIFILILVVLYVIFGIRHVARAAEPDNYYVSELPEFPSDILDRNYILVSSHSNSKDTISYYLLIFDDCSSVTSDFMADTVNDGTTSFTLQGVNGVRFWYQFSFDDGWVKSTKSGDIFSLNPIQLHIHQSTFNVPYTYDSNVIAITKNTDVISSIPIIDYGECGSDYEIDLPNGETFVLFPNGKYLDCPYVIVMYNADRQSACAFYSTCGFYRYNNDTNSFMSGDRYYKAYSDGTFDSTSYVSASSYIGEPIFWSNHNVLNPDKQTVFFSQNMYPLILGKVNLMPNQIVQMTLVGIGGLMVVVVLSVIGLVAFRKGWQFLKTALHQA